MEEPRADEQDDRKVDIELDEETLDHYQARADAAGRTLEAQLAYELKVNHGLCEPDPGDQEARERKRVFARIFSKRPLMG